MTQTTASWLDSLDLDLDRIASWAPQTTPSQSVRDMVLDRLLTCDSCGRRLTTQTSIVRGVGPKCAKAGGRS